MAYGLKASSGNPISAHVSRAQKYETQSCDMDVE